MERRRRIDRAVRLLARGRCRVARLWVAEIVNGRIARTARCSVRVVLLCGSLRCGVRWMDGQLRLRTEPFGQARRNADRRRFDGASVGRCRTVRLCRRRFFVARRLHAESLDRRALDPLHVDMVDLRRAAHEDALLRFARNRPAVREYQHGSERHDFFLSADFVPGDPEVVGVSRGRLAEMFLELVGLELEAAGGLARRRGRFAAQHRFRFVVGIDDQVAFDLDRRLLVLAVEDQPPAEAPRRRSVGMVQRVFVPDRNDPLRFLVDFLRFLLLGPGNCLRHVEVRATGQRAGQRGGGERALQQAR